MQFNVFKFRRSFGTFKKPLVTGLYFQVMNVLCLHNIRMSRK